MKFGNHVPIKYLNVISKTENCILHGFKKSESFHKVFTKTYSYIGFMLVAVILGYSVNLFPRYCTRVTAHTKVY